jgi:hypothetical protein
MVRVLPIEALQDLGGPPLVLEGLVRRRRRAQEGQRVEGPDLHLLGMPAEQRFHRLLVGQGARGMVAPAGGAVAGLADRARGRRRGRRIEGVESGDVALLDRRPAADRLGLGDGRAAGGHLLGGGRRPDRMPPRHRDPPVRHGALRVARGHALEAAPRLVVEERMEQRGGVAQLLLHGRRTRGLQVDGAHLAQIADRGSRRRARQRGRSECQRRQKHGSSN